MARFARANANSPSSYLVPNKKQAANSDFGVSRLLLAERARFELAVDFTPRWFSKPVH